MRPSAGRHGTLCFLGRITSLWVIAPALLGLLGNLTRDWGGPWSKLTLLLGLDLNLAKNNNLILCY